MVAKPGPPPDQPGRATAPTNLLLSIQWIVELYALHPYLFLFYFFILCAFILFSQTCVNISI